jgi:hypothetical protein
MVSKASQAQASRARAREQRLAAARERRQRLDPDQAAHERRIDEAIVDVEIAWERRASAAQAVEAAESSVVQAMERLAEERVSAAEVSMLTGIDQSVLRRLRRQRLDTAASGSQVTSSASTPRSAPGGPAAQGGPNGAAEAAAGVASREG